jgi:hypothetical protein
VVEFGLQENIAHNLLFIDGLTRSGKSIFSPLIGTFARCEQIRFFNLIEQIVPALQTDSIDAGYARSLMRTQFNEFVYDMMLSRNANFRKDDQTSIYNHPDSSLYERRLNHSDGDEIVFSLREKKRIFPIMTHDLMVSIDLLLNLELDFKMIELYRHPIDLINSQYQRGWGRRFGYDPRAFTLTVSNRNKLYPWYAVGEEELWESFTDLERVVWMTITLLQKSIEKQRIFSTSKNFLTIKFENFLSNPIIAIKKISAFLNTHETSDTYTVLRQLNLPRTVNVEGRSRLSKTIHNQLKPELSYSLAKLTSQYELNCFDIPHV